MNDADSELMPLLLLWREETWSEVVKFHEYGVDCVKSSA